MRLHALDLDAEVDEPALGGAQPQLGRLERDRHVACRCALDDLARAVADDLLVADDVEDDVAARLEALLERHLRRPHRRREPALHVRRAAPVEAAVDDVAAERLLRPRAPVADRHDVDVRVERERAAAARARQPGDDQRVRRERRRRADVPAVELEPERRRGSRRRSRCSAAPRPGSASPPSPGSRCGSAISSRSSPCSSVSRGPDGVDDCRARDHRATSAASDQRRRGRDRSASRRRLWPSAPNTCTRHASKWSVTLSSGCTRRVGVGAHLDGRAAGLDREVEIRADRLEEPHDARRSRRPGRAGRAGSAPGAGRA